MSTVGLWHLYLMHTCFWYTYGFQKSVDIFYPTFEFFLPILLLNKILNLHLFKLSTTEHKITRADFVSESFSLLGNPKRHIRIKRINHIFVVGKDPLRRFWP